MSIPVRPEDDAADRLRQLELVCDVGRDQLDGDKLLEELLGQVRDLFRADTVVVLLRAGDHLVAAAAVGLEEEVYQGVRVPFGRGFAGRVAAEQRPVRLGRVDALTVVNPLLWEKGIRSLLGVPMMAGGEVMGVLHVGSYVPRDFDEHDTHLLQLAADRIALATAMQKTRQERAAAIELQRSLLPTSLPSVDGVELATRYVPSSQAGVGGDWYDVFALPSGPLGVVIGDVAGHGLDAAVVMGRLRSALRAYALDTDDPAEVLHRLDRQTTYFEHPAMATVAYGVFDPERAVLRTSLAGHLPPVMARPGRSAELLDIPVDPPVGIDVSPGRRVASVHVPPGAVVCFYTDGLVERRYRPIDIGLRDLCRAVTARGASEACATVMSRMVGGRPPRDDVAVLMLRCQEIGAETEEPPATGARAAVTSVGEPAGGDRLELR